MMISNMEFTTEPRPVPFLTNGASHHSYQPNALHLDLISSNAPEPQTPHDQRRRAALLADSPERTSSSMSSYKPGSRTLGARMSTQEFERVDICTMETSDQSSTTSSSATVIASTYLTKEDHQNCGCCLCCVKTKIGSEKCFTKFKKLFAGLGESSVWKSILLGQLIALLLCTKSVLCQILLENYNIRIPAGQSLITYFLLGVIYSTLWCCHRFRKHPTGGFGDTTNVYKSASMSEVMRRRGIRYFFLAVSDVQGNYLIHRAFQYTTLTSIQLLDCFSIPTVLVLSWFVLHLRYGLSHIAGLALALMSVVALVWSDIDDGRGGVSAGGKNRLVGDMLTLGGSFLYGISQVGLNHTVHYYDPHEFLGLIGVFGTTLTAVQMCLLERDEIMMIRWEIWEVSVLLAAFTIAQLAFYVCLPTMLRLSSAAALNLSLLSTDFYTIIAGVVFFQFKFHGVYIFSWLLVMLGLLIYSIQPVPMSFRKSRRRSLSPDEMNGEVCKSSPS